MTYFIMMCGISGSGKSTYAKSYDPEAVIVSSDSIRGELWGDESIQGNPVHVFSIAEARILRALSEKKDVVFDATNLTVRDRARFIDRVRELSFVKEIPIQLMCADLESSLEGAIRRNQQRARKVPEAVIRRQFNKKERPELSEGFDSIIRVPADKLADDYPG